MERKILTSSALEDFVDLDQSDHKTKDLARLFLEAMNDWPTTDLTNIEEFISVVENYFGYPLTVTKISNKKLSGQNAWQIEAGSSLTELIDISTRLCNQSDFRIIVENILTYYEAEYS